MSTKPTPRVRVPAKAAAGEMIEIKTLISHEMESGQRKDQGRPGICLFAMWRMGQRPSSRQTTQSSSKPPYGLGNHPEQLAEFESGPTRCPFHDSVPAFALHSSISNVDVSFSKSGKNSWNSFVSAE